MKHTPVKSSAIRSVGYDAETKKMEVTFTSGHTYEFPDVDPEDHEALINAESVGKHFNTHWRNR